MSRARPKYNRAKVDVILMRIAVDGMSLRAACEEHDLSHGTFSEWIVDDVDGLADRYARAQKARAHVLADEIIEIADDGTNDTYVDEKGQTRVDQDHIQRSRLRVDTRKWVLAKVLPKVYGEKVEVDAGPNALAALSEAKTTLAEKMDAMAKALNRNAKGG